MTCPKISILLSLCLALSSCGDDNGGDQDADEDVAGEPDVVEDAVEDTPADGEELLSCGEVLTCMNACGSDETCIGADGHDHVRGHELCDRVRGPHLHRLHHLHHDPLRDGDRRLHGIHLLARPFTNPPAARACRRPVKGQLSPCP